MTVLVVGSVAFDTVETPAGKAEKALGGSATYFSVAASFFAPVNLVAVVGEDFGPKEMSAFDGRRIDLTGLQKVKGETFHWSAVYSQDMNDRTTLSTCLNVFENFAPDLPENYRNSEVVFLANIDPDLQMDVLNQVADKSEFVACDTMNHWITSKRERLIDTLRRVDLLVINDSEAKELTETPNLWEAMDRIQDYGPRYVVIKRGEYGAVFKGPSGVFIAPAFPLANLVDPTGAGDSFAGGLMGYLAGLPRITEDAIRKAIVYGTVIASFNCESFSLQRIVSLNKNEIEERYRAFTEIVRIP